MTLRWHAPMVYFGLITEYNRMQHIDIEHFAIQEWKNRGDIVMCHIPGVISPADDLTKPLGWVLHACHARRIMGHFL